MPGIEAGAGDGALAAAGAERWEWKAGVDASAAAGLAGLLVGSGTSGMELAHPVNRMAQAGMRKCLCMEKCEWAEMEKWRVGRKCRHRK